MPDNDAHGTRPLCYEQLLIGRMAGASDNDDNDGKGWDNDNDGKRRDHWVGGQQQQLDEEGRQRRDKTTTPAPMLLHHDNAPPAPSLASNCLWGGTQVEWEMMGRGNNGKGEPAQWRMAGGAGAETSMAGREISMEGRETTRKGDDDGRGQQQ